MRVPRVRLSIRQTLMGIAALAVVMAWGVEEMNRGPFRFEFDDTQVVENEPLVNPTRFLALSGNRLELEGEQSLVVEALSRTYFVTPGAWWRPDKPEDLDRALAEELSEMPVDGTRHIVDLVPAPDGRMLLYVRGHVFRCGTEPNVLRIRVPLFRRIVYRNPRRLIGIGSLRVRAKP